MNKEEARNLLPWYAVGALDADEARAVEAHLAGSAQLKRELAELRVLHKTVGEVAEDEPQFRPALINDALRRIDDYEAARAPQRSTDGTSIVDWLRETLVGGWFGSPVGARVAMVAQFAVIAVLGGALLMPMVMGPADPGQVFTTSSGSTSAPETGGTALTVLFEPDAAELEIRELLAEVGGEIVAGPSGQGAYTVRIDTESADEATRQLERLRGADAVRFAGEAE